MNPAPVAYPPGDVPPAVPVPTPGTAPDPAVCTFGHNNLQVSETLA